MRRLAGIALLLASPLRGDPFDLLQTDLATALEVAASSGQHLHLAFMGEGWSMASGRFQSEVLQSASFQEFAGAHLVEAQVFSRRNPKLTKAETARLQALVIHFDIQSWPTLILLGPDGTEILRHGYKDLSGEAYVALLRQLLGMTPQEPAKAP